MPHTCIQLLAIKKAFLHTGKIAVPSAVSIFVPIININVVKRTTAQFEQHFVAQQLILNKT